MTATGNAKLLKEVPQVEAASEEVGISSVENLDLRPRIMVMGVGGAGANAVNNMIRSHLEGVEFIVCNTDAQALNQALTKQRIQLGMQITQGLGAGSHPEMGRAAAEESGEEIMRHLEGANMLFITAGMGGGTGTGAAPVIARMAREHGILTVGVVTKPFHFEGAHRMRTAEKGIEELQQFVDTLIVIPNQNLFRISTEKTTFADAFKMADDVLYSGVRSVTDLMIMPGLINLDFADIRTVMSEMGKAMMGTGEAQGDRRAINAAEAAILNPLLDDVSVRGARGVLISITGGMDLTLFEVDEAANRIRDEVDADANIIFGSTFDERLSGRIRVSVVATGIDQAGVTAVNRTLAMGIEVLSDNAPIEIPESPMENSSETFYKEEATIVEFKDEANVNDALAFEFNAEEPKDSSIELRMDEMPELKVEQPIERQYAPEPQQKQGFFERMRNSLMGKSQSSAPAPQRQPEQPTKPMRVRPVETADLFAGQDEEVSDIPAYLRRKG